MREKKNKRRSTFSEIWRNYRRNFSGMLGLVIVVGILVTIFVGNFIYDYDKDVIGQNITQRRQPPSSDHVFGTDEFGRDILARIIWGGRYSLAIGLAAVLLSSVAGIFLGAMAGYYGGAVETIIMRIADIFQAIPAIMLGICFVTAFGQSIFNLTIAVAIGAIPAVTRVTRASVITVKDMEYVEAARAIGANNFVIIFRHVLLNALSPVIVQATLRIGVSIVGIAALSFIGLGITAPTPEWGAMLSSARQYLRGSDYMALYPGLAIMVTVLGFNLIGDGVRDSMDPKLKK